MKKQTKILLAFFTVILVSILFTVCAYGASSGSCGTGLAWSFNESSGTLTISGSGDMTDYTYVSSAPWYSFRTQIRNLVIGTSVKSIGDNAFCGYDKITSVEIPDSVTDIGDYSFAEMGGVTSLKIGKGLTGLRDTSFCMIPKLTSVDLYMKIRNGNNDYGYKELGKLRNGAQMQLFYYQLYIASENFLKGTSNISHSDEIQTLSTLYSFNTGIGACLATRSTFVNDNPRYYFISNQYSHAYGDLPKHNYINVLVDIEYTDRAYIQRCEAAIESMITECGTYIGAKTEETEVTAAIHDFIIDRIDYAYEDDGKTPMDTSWAHNIIGAALKMNGVCETFSETFHLLCNANGIDSLCVVGSAKGGRHEWNVLKIGSAWYGVDVTWDDNGKLKDSDYEYFCVTKSEFTDHIPDNNTNMESDYFQCPIPTLSDVSLNIQHPTSPKPVCTGVTGTTVSFTEVPGCEYRIYGGDWQKSGTFTGLTPNTVYGFQQRYAESDGLLHGPNGVIYQLSTTAETVEPVITASAPTVNIIDGGEVTLVYVSGCEYRCNNGTWQSSPIFDGLITGQYYTFYQRIAATSGKIAGPASEGYTVFIAGGFDSGTGTKDSPYIIKQISHLIFLSNQVNSGINYTGKYIKLDADISFNDTLNLLIWDIFAPDRVWTPIGTSTRAFEGYFDGNGYTVSGLYTDEDLSYCGLFGYCKNAEIKNVGVIKSLINGKDHVGAICGYSENTSFENCYSGAMIKSTGNGVGGICGTSLSNAANKGVIEGCYNIGNISGNSYVGGILGSGNGTVKNCYYLIGYATDGNDVFQNGIGASSVGSRTADISGCTSGLTNAQMKTSEAYRAFDFSDIWTIGKKSGYSYPTVVTHRLLTISYINSDGSQASPKYTASVGEGNTYNVVSPTITGLTPDKEKVTGTVGSADIVVTVTYLKTSTYKIVWTVDGTETVTYSEKGKTPVFSGETVKPSDEMYTYSFVGWDADNDGVVDDLPDSVTGNLSFTAIFRKTPKSNIESIASLISDGGEISVDGATGYINGIKTNTKYADLLKNFVNSLNIVANRENGDTLTENDTVGTGTRISLVSEGVIIDEVTAVVFGDISGDGKVDALDIDGIRLAAKGVNIPEGAYGKAADTVTDGTLNTADIIKARLIMNGFVVK